MERGRKNPNGLAESGYPNYVAYPNTDWYKELFQNKIMSEHTISVVGASDNVNYNFLVLSWITRG